MNAHSTILGFLHNNPEVVLKVGTYQSLLYVKACRDDRNFIPTLLGCGYGSSYEAACLDLANQLRAEKFI